MRKRLKNSLIYYLARLLIALIQNMGFERSLRFGSWLGRTVYKRARRVRQQTCQTLSMAYDELTQNEIQRLARQVFEHFGKGIVEVINTAKIPDLTEYVQLTPDSKKVLDAVLARGRGVVYITGHVGNWELMARTLASLGYPINAIGQKSYDPRLTRLLARYRDEGRVHTLWRGEANLMENMAGVLQRGQIMGLLIDQDTNVPGTFVEFFGRQAWTPSAGAVLARKVNAPIVMGFNYRRPQGGYFITIQEFLPSQEADFARAVQLDTQGMSRVIEQHIRQHPTEWVWMHQRHKTQPTSQRVIK